MAAAVIMSGMLIVSSVVTTVLIQPQDYGAGGKANGNRKATGSNF